jgi:hypothetical protein
MFNGNNIDQMFQTLRTQFKGDSFWSEYFKSDEFENAAIHLGVFVEPYIQYILEGKKTIESRFSMNRSAPYKKVCNGDILLLKRSGGPIVALCLIGEAWFYELEESSWREIKREYRDQLCAQDPDFWKDRSAASFASLMRIHNVQQINPIKFLKRDRRGWVVLKSTQVDELPL